MVYYGLLSALVVIICICFVAIGLELNETNVKKLLYNLPAETLALIFNSIPLEGKNLELFVRFRRYPHIDTEQLYNPRARLAEILDKMLKGELPPQILNDILPFRAFMKTTEGVQLFFNYQDKLTQLYVTDRRFNPHNLSSAQRRDLIRFVIRQQYRVIHDEDFWGSLTKSLDDWVNALFSEDTWEIFDLLFIQAQALHYDEASIIFRENIETLVTKMLPLAEKDDLALFRLASYLVEYEDIMVELEEVMSFIQEVEISGTEVQKAILSLARVMIRDLDDIPLEFSQPKVFKEPLKYGKQPIRSYESERSEEFSRYYESEKSSGPNKFEESEHFDELQNKMDIETEKSYETKNPNQELFGDEEAIKLEKPHEAENTEKFKQCSGSEKSYELDDEIKDFDQSVEFLYDTFKEILKHRNDPSPAFLLELLAVSAKMMTNDAPVDLLANIFEIYHLETISPLLVRKILQGCRGGAAFRESTLDSGPLDNTDNFVSKDLLQKEQHYRDRILNCLPRHNLNTHEKLKIWRRKNNRLLGVKDIYNRSFTELQNQFRLERRKPFFLNIQSIYQWRLVPDLFLLEAKFEKSEMLGIVLRDGHYLFKCLDQGVANIYNFARAIFSALATGEIDNLKQLHPILLSLMKTIIKRKASFNVVKNDERLLQICHDDAPKLQMAANILGIFTQTFSSMNLPIKVLQP